MIDWYFYPKSMAPPNIIHAVVNVFEDTANKITSDLHNLNSNKVLEKIRPGLENLEFEVETGKKAHQKIHVPVLFGKGGKPEKSFEADAFHSKYGCVIEVEAGRGVLNNQFLKDLFQACMMHEVRLLTIAVRKKYKSSNDFDRVVRWFDTLYASNRLSLPLVGIAIIGY